MRSDVQRNRAALIEAYVSFMSVGRSPTLVEVASAAKVARATAYRHFGVIEGLQRAVYLNCLDEVENVVVTTSARSAPLVDLLNALVTDILVVTQRFAFHLLPQPASDPMVERSADRLLQPMSRMLHAAQHRGELRTDIPPRYLAEALVAIVTAAAYRQSNLSEEEAAPLVVDFFLRGASLHSPD